MERIQQLFRLLCHDYHGCQCQSDFPRSTHFVQAHAGILRFDHPRTNTWLCGLFWSVFPFSSLSRVRRTFSYSMRTSNVRMYVFFRCRFTSTLFFNILLPPIILDSAYNLYDRDFLSNLTNIVQFAVIGTLFNVFSIGYLLRAFYTSGIMGDFKIENEAGELVNQDLSMIQCFIFRYIFI